jgi:hypothetical protein
MERQHLPASWMTRVSCSLWGHVVDNEQFQRSPGSRRRCRCGAEYLREDGATTHVRHTLGCFFRHHSYVLLANRDGVHEYVCVRCGHPLVFPVDGDRFAGRGRFAKKVRYACGLFGHRVSAVASRNGFVEYACHCGHSFLMHSTGSDNIRSAASLRPTACDSSPGAPDMRSTSATIAGIRSASPTPLLIPGGSPPEPPDIRCAPPKLEERRRVRSQCEIRHREDSTPKARETVRP